MSNELFINIPWIAQRNSVMPTVMTAEKMASVQIETLY